MRTRSIPRLFAPVSKTPLPVVSFALLVALAAFALPAFAASDEPAAAAGVLSADAAQRASLVSGEAPVLDPLSGMTVLVNETADQTIHATDAQGDPLTFTAAFGPAYMTVTTTDPGTGSATGNIHLAPGPGDAGQTQGSVAVSDGILTDQRTFLIHVTTPPAAPVLDPVTDMTVPAGSSAVQTLHAADANGDELTFYLASGPSYASVTTDDGMLGQGSLRITPSYAVAGSATARVGVTDGVLSDEKSLAVTVTRVEVAPVLAQPAPVDARGGATKDVLLTATDANGDPLSFSKVSGPSYMTVTTGDPGQGSAFGTMRFTPDASVNDTVTAVVSVSDGELSDQKAVFVTVRANTPPVLDPVFNISVRAGETAVEYVRATDAEEDGMILSLVNSPSFASIFTYYEYPGFIYGQITFSPNDSSVGTWPVTVRVTDGIRVDEKTFNVTVFPRTNAPVLTQPENMTDTVGEVAQQTLTATDPDGNYVYMYKSGGPGFMSVTSYGNYGTATGLVTLRPGVGDVGNTLGSVTASDFQSATTKSFAITVEAGNFPAPCPASRFVPVFTQFGQGSFGVQSADLDGDGVLDLVIEMPDYSRVLTALGRGDGTFGTVVDLDASNGPVSGAIADFNRDDALDIAVSNYYSGNVSIYLGDGAGHFGPKRNFTVGSGPRTISAVDATRDGKLDLLVVNQDLGSVSMLRGVGDGTFLAATIVTGGASDIGDIATPDLNGDGAPDLVAAGQNPVAVSVFLNNGTGAFGPRVNYPIGTPVYGFATGDLNGDGKIDVVTASYYPGSIFVFLGSGNGTLGPKREFSAAYGTEQVAIADFNGDGKPDLAATGTSGTGADGASIFLGDGTGRFAPRTSAGAGGVSYGLTVGDFDDDLRADLAFTDYYQAGVRLLLNASCAPDLDHPPVVKAPKKVAGAEGAAITFTFTATDPDGPAVTSLGVSFAGLPLGNNASFVQDELNSAGTVTWTPTYMDARPTAYPITITATNVLSGSAMTKITVANTNRAPLASAGGPYTAFVGVPLQLDGRGSADPDGDPLTFAWVFGDGASGTGAQPSHAFAAIGLYGVALTVSDGSLTGLATTTVNIVGMFQARAFTASGNRNIRLNAGKPQWCVQIEAVGRAFVNETVDMGSLVMRSTGTGSVEEIHAISDKSAFGGDKDANGVEEITACFAKDDLRLLFANLHGSTSATVSFEANLYTGGRFRATMDVGIIAGGGNLAATISPNPLNPSAILTYVTTKPGPVSLRFFDPHGRLVRTVFRESYVEAGYHDVPIDGRDDRGVSLASGVYYYRIHAAEGTTTGRFTVLR